MLEKNSCLEFWLSYGRVLMGIMFKFKQKSDFQTKKIWGDDDGKERRICT